MKLVKYILVNESYSELCGSASGKPSSLELSRAKAKSSAAQDAVLAIRNSRVSDFRHSHIISAAGLTRPELISVLLLARKQWPDAKILGVSELGLEVRDGRIVSIGRLYPSDAMNVLRRELSDLP